MARIPVIALVFLCGCRPSSARRSQVVVADEHKQGDSVSIEDVVGFEDVRAAARDEPKPLWVENVSVAAMAVLIGVDRQQKTAAAIIAITSSIAVIGGQLTSSVLTTLDPGLVPHDFQQKGTISNVAQDVSTPHGRLWTVALFVSALLLLISMYPFWLYKPWAPWVTFEENPFRHPTFESSGERWVRTIWTVLPNVGFMLTASIPSLSGVRGYELVLTGVHNVCAPLSMLFCMLMETIQLGFGENAFAHFFSSENASIYGPLTSTQRVRVVIVIFSWISGIVFVSIQAYLNFIPNTNRRLALCSYFGEVFGMCGAFSLPAIMGLGYLLGDEMWGSQGSVMGQTIDFVHSVR